MGRSQSLFDPQTTTPPWPVLSTKAGPGLTPGDPAPMFSARATNNPNFQFSAAGGRYLVLCFAGTAASGRSRAIMEGVVARSRRRFDDFFGAFFGVSMDPADEAEGRLVQSLPGVRYFWDFDGRVTRLYAGEAAARSPEAAAEAGFTVILDPFMRVLANIPFGEPAAHAEQVAAFIACLPPPERYAGSGTPAPVLVLPRLFEPELCRSLIDLYERQGGGDSGFMKEQDGLTVPVLDHKFKRRSDVSLDEGEQFAPYRDAIRTRVVRRLLPEIEKVFQFKATRMERYLIACYDSSTGGFFKAHRDNTTAGTAHRRFAVTINLNAEEFEGGELRFPEFGERSYRAPTGGCVVFSCSLLHEALPVTRGRRYACLPFLYDEASAAIRQRNLDKVGKETINRNAPAVAHGAQVS